MGYLPWDLAEKPPPSGLYGKRNTNKAYLSSMKLPLRRFTATVVLLKDFPRMLPRSLASCTSPNSPSPS